MSAELRLPAASRGWAGCTGPPDVTYSARYLDREERYEIARLREAGLSVAADRGPAGPRPRRRSAGSWAATPTRAPGAYQPERAAPAGLGAAAPPQAVQAVSRNPALRGGGAGHAGLPLLARAGQREAQGAVYPDDPVDAGQPRDDLPVAVRLPPRRALQRELQGLPARRAAAVRRRRGRRPRRRGQHRRRGPDRAAPARSRGPPGPRPPRGRPGHGLDGVQLRRRHHRRADDRLPHPAPPARRAHRRRRRPRGHRTAGRATCCSVWSSSPDPGPRHRDGPPRPRHRPKPGPPGLLRHGSTPPARAAATRTPTACSSSTVRRAPTSVPATTAAAPGHRRTELNDRPRKRLGFHTPREQLAKLLENQSVATTP